jgi:integrase
VDRTRAPDERASSQLPLKISARSTNAGRTCVPPELASRISSSRRSPLRTRRSQPSVPFTTARLSTRSRRGYGRIAIQHAFDLLGSILQRALEGGQIQTNPARAVRKAPRPRRAEVRPLSPVTIERMRAASSPRDATLISVVAYAGLRPGEALALQWRDIREQTIVEPS